MPKKTDLQPTMKVKVVNGKPLITLFERILFRQPDRRNYLQGSVKTIPSPLLEMDKTMDDITPLYVATDIPLTEEFVYNYDEYAAWVRYETTKNGIAELGYDEEENKEEVSIPDTLPILTVEGMKFYHEQFTIHDNTQAKLETFEDNTEDENWNPNW